MVASETTGRRDVHGAPQSVSTLAGCAVVRWTCLAVLFLTAFSCCDDKEVKAPDPGRRFDFTLTDVNPNSLTHRQPVSIESLEERAVVLYAGSAG